MTENTNPLNKYFRQPAIYVSLPSGTNYPPHVVTPAQTGELGVMPMTAKDEIRFAWEIKSYDLDTILVAIRIATYGETMEINFNVPGANENVSHTVNLPSILDQLRSVKVDNAIVLKDGLKITVRPLTYKDMTHTSLQTFQQQKMYSAVQDSQLSDEDKATRFNEAFKTLTELNASILLKNMEMITMQDGTEITDTAHIKEFVDNANTTLIKEIETKLTDLRSQGAVKPLKLKATEEQIKKGAPVTYEVPVTFDTANFFV